MQGCLNLAKTLSAGAVFVALLSAGTTTVMAKPAPTGTKALPSKVEIFTTDAFPITGIDELKRLVGEKNVIVYALDGVDKVEKEFPIVGAKTKAEAVTLGRQLLNAHRKEIAPRVYASYGGLYRADRKMRVGVVACGYADGYPRHAPTGTPLLVNGQRTRTLGRVSMDMLSVDLSALPDADIGSPVTLWGEGMPVDDVAQAAGTISYELLCALAARVPVVV